MEDGWILGTCDDLSGAYLSYHLSDALYVTIEFHAVSEYTIWITDERHFDGFPSDFCFSFILEGAPNRELQEAAKSALFQYVIETANWENV